MYTTFSHLFTRDLLPQVCVQVQPLAQRVCDQTLSNNEFKYIDGSMNEVNFRNGSACADADNHAH